MKAAFPVYLIPIPEGYQVHFPDMPNCVTWGEDAADALNMAQDALSVCLLSMEDHKQALPQPSAPTPPEDPSHIMAMVPVDTEAYRRQTDTRAVRKKRLPSGVDGRPGRPARRQLLQSIAGKPAHYPGHHLSTPTMLHSKRPHLPRESGVFCKRG